MSSARWIAIVLAGFLAGVGYSTCKASENHTEKARSFLAKEGRRLAALPADLPAKSSGASNRAEVSGSSLYALIRLQAAASAGSDGIRYTGQVSVISIETYCRAGKLVQLSASKQIRGAPSVGEEPSVATLDELLCIPVSPDLLPSALLGVRIPVQRVRLPEFVIGEEYSSPEPDDLNGAGISLFVPDGKDGRMVGVFILAGFLEDPEDGYRQAVTAVGAAAIKVTEEFPEHRFPLTLYSPNETPVTVMVPAPVANKTRAAFTAVYSKRQ